MKIKSIILFTGILFFSTTIFAQRGKHHQMRAKIEKEKAEFLERELQLTDTEKSKFLPLFKEFGEKREKLHEKKRRIMMNYRKNSLNYSAKEIEKFSDDFVALDSELAKLNIEYHQKFKKILPPAKVLLLYMSEQKFKKQLIKKMRHGKMHNKNIPPPVD